MSVTFEGKAPYERVLAYNSVVAEDGTRFSKTGFMIKFDEAAEKLGADTIRYLFAGANVAADVRFGFNLGDEARRKLLSFWNIYVFFMTYAILEKPALYGAKLPEHLEVTDVWLLARTDKFIAASSNYMDRCKTSDVIKEFELYIDDVSNWYVRSNRRRFWKQGYSENKHAAYWCLYKALKVMVQVMAPIIPFLTEYMWQNMVRAFEIDSEESVHLSDWPESVWSRDGADSARSSDGADSARLSDSSSLTSAAVDENISKQAETVRRLIIDEKILKQTDAVRRLIGIALKIRNENQLKVKQPLSCMYVVTTAENEAAVNRMTDIIKDELNIKELVFLSDCSSLNTKYLTLNFRKAGSELKERVQALKGCLDNISKDEIEAMVAQRQAGESLNVPGWTESVPADFFVINTRSRENIAIAADKDITAALDTTLTEELLLEGLYRELLRQCQLLRKEAGLRVDQRIHLAIRSSSETIKTAIERYAENIAHETLAYKLTYYADAPIELAYSSDTQMELSYASVKSDDNADTSVKSSYSTDTQMEDTDVDAPIIDKAVDVCEYTVMLQIGL